MASRPKRASLRAAAPPASEGPFAANATRSRAAVVRVAVLAIVFAAALVFGYLRQLPAPSQLVAEPAAPAAGDARTALFRAAQRLNARLAPGGLGLAFTATQVQMLRPAPGGPELILQPDRDHPQRSPQAVDQIVLGSVSGRGAATRDSFFAEWFEGAGENGLPTFEGQAAYTALVRDGALWRRDHANAEASPNWNASADIPGFGVDPESLRELPELLRHLETPTFLGADADGRHWSGVSDATWYPGAVAVDGAPFTGSPIAIELWLDESDDLVGIFAVARNLNETTYQLLCVNRIGFIYPEGQAAVPSDPAGGAQ